jgi:predicted CXXCH cytochrome family protein
LTWPRCVATTLGCVLLLAGCSSQTKHRLLCVFFTGLDQTNSPPLAVASAASTDAAAQPAAAAAIPVVYFHKPYFERNCEACHVTGQSEELRATGSDLCLECHQKLIGNATYVHAPVNDGKCNLCHVAHKSTERFLLTGKAQDVCLDCHKRAKMVKVKGHATMGTAECVSCHDPHRSDQRKLLKAPP